MKQKILSIVLSIVMLSSLFNGFTITANSEGSLIEIGDYIQMGTEKGQPILWRCVAFEKVIGEDENGNPIMDSTQTVTKYEDGYLPLITADTAICDKSFDKEGAVATGSHGRDLDNRQYGSTGGSNYWGDSNIRDYFNSDEETVTYTCGNRPSYSHEAGFLTNFTKTEKNAVKSVTHKALLAECDYNALPDNDKKGGSAVYMNDKPLSPASIDDILQNCSDAYYELFTDKFFLLDVQQVVNMHNNESILGSGYYMQYKTTGTAYDYPYLVMAPAYTTNVFRVSMDNGMFYAQPATYIECYARPAFYLDPTTEFWQGSGTKAAPYNFSVFTNGMGTEADPYEIGDLATLKKFRDSVNAGEDYAGKYIKLTSNINMLDEYNEANGKSWTPIGASDSSGSAHRVFAGTFDGNGKTINVYINSANAAALFLHTGADAIIKNLNVSGTISVTGDDAAGICMSNQGTVQGCTFKGSIDGANHLGGICAYNDGTISRCINSGDVVGTGSYIGGICADNRKTIENCYNYFIPISGSTMVGGICGSNHSTDTSVKNCYDIGIISGGEYIGSVCGKNNNPTGVSACYYLADRGGHGNGGYADGATALQTSALGTQSSFSGWDFDNIWEIKANHPVLRGVTEPNMSIYGFFDGGSGTKTSPYEISSLTTLERFRDSVNSGHDYQSTYIKLTANIDMSGKYNAENGKSWTPIGSLFPRNPFKGNFSGDGHTISGLYQCAGNSSNTMGLFCCNVGGLIEKLTVSGFVSAPDGSATAGGICGDNMGGTIRECVNNCDVSGKGTAIIGGICGYLENNAKIERCYNTGNISCDLAHAGGIVGRNYEGSVKNCYNTGTISSGVGNQFTKIGGVCGYTNKNTENSYNYGTVSFGYSASGTEGVYGGGADSLQSCYYNTDSYAVTHAAMGKTAEEFKLQATFDGWDFDNVWEMSETHGRPILKAIPEPAPPHKHDMSVECGNNNTVTFDKALTSKDGMLYIDGVMVNLKGWNNPGDSYWYIDLPNGNYYLADDIEIANDINVSAMVNLCLNGHTLNINQNSIVTNLPQGALNVCDCGENGTITGTEYSDSTVDAKIVSCSEFSLYGGKVINTSDNANAKKQAIATYGGTAKIFGGEVVSLNDNAVYIASDDESNLSGLLHLSGAPKISGANDKSDIYIANGGRGAGIIIDSPLTAKKAYRVAADQNNIFTYQWTMHMEDKTFSDYFISAAEDKSIKKEGGELVICDYEIIEPSPSPSPTATPNPDENAECIKITAIYLNDGTLKSIALENVKVSEIAPEQNIPTKKIFYWESLENMRPICLSN